MPFENGHALVVGISKYKNVTPLPSSVTNDATSITSKLIDPSFAAYRSENVDTLTNEDATAGGIRGALADLAAKSKSSDTVVLFYSGHGGQLVSNQSFLIPYDFEVADSATCISSAELASSIEKIKASRILILLDACHAGGMAIKSHDNRTQMKSGVSDSALDELAKGVGRVLIASSRSDEVSLVLSGMSNSLFTHCLMEALSGHAVSDEMGFIRVFNVFNYISDAVPTLAAKSGQTQRPLLKAMDLETNFPIGLYKGGSKAIHGSIPTVAIQEIKGILRLRLEKRLIDRWRDLATYFEVPASDKQSFLQGREPEMLFEWISQRDKMKEVPKAFEELKFDDLLPVITSRP